MNPLERDLRVTPLVLWSCKSEGVSTSASATKCKVQATKMHGYLFKLFNVYQHGDIMYYAGYFLFGLSVLSKALQLWEEPIYCDNEEIPEKALNMFCWSSSTYTLPEPGKEEYQNYYKWVNVVLLVQGVLCLGPKWIWYLIKGKKKFYMIYLL